MKKLLLVLPVLGWLIGAMLPAMAQSPVKLCVDLPTNTGSCIVVDSANPLPTSTALSASNQITGNATGTTGAVVGTLAASAGLTNYLCGFDVSAIGGTAAVGPITVAGLAGGSLVYQLASSAGGVTLARQFQPCLPASAANTAITVTTTADGTATGVSVNSWGFRK